MGSWKTAFGSYLKADDLEGREARVVVESVEFEDIKGDHGTERKLVAKFVGKDKGLILNRTNAESIASIAGDDDFDNWPGACLILWVDPNVTFGGKKMPAIRIKMPRQANGKAAQAQVQRVVERQAERAAAPPVELPDAPPMTDDDIPF